MKGLRHLFGSLQTEKVTIISVLNVGEPSHWRVIRNAKGIWCLISAYCVQLVNPRRCNLGAVLIFMNEKKGSKRLSDSFKVTHCNRYNMALTLD